MTKIICTGRPSHGGIAASIEKYYPNTFFVNRNNGFDLTLNEYYNRFIEIVKNYNVFINHSQIILGKQEQLLNDVFNIWHKNNIRGHIISIGSIVELNEWKSLDILTSNEKNSIKNTSLRLNSEMIKTTHLITSGFNRHGPEEDIKINPDKIVDVIKFILETDIDIPLIYVEKTNDARIQKWRTLNNPSF